MFLPNLCSCSVEGHKDGDGEGSVASSWQKRAARGEGDVGREEAGVSWRGW